MVVISGLIWRTVRYALAFPLWGDEAYVAVNFLTRDFAGLTRPLEYFQIVPPGFLWAEWLAVRSFGTGERALRLVPYLAGVASLLLFWRFCREVATRRTVLLAVAMLAASFYPVRHSTEVKPYAIDLLISLALLSTGWATGRDIRSSRAWLGLFGVTIVGVWCSYAAVFPAASVALFLGARVFRERSMSLATLWVTYGLILTLSWGIVFVTYARPQSRAAEFLPHLETWKDAFPPMAEPWRLPGWLLDVHTGNMLAYPYGGNNFGSTLTTLLVIAGCSRMGRRRARRPLLFLLLGAAALRPGRGGPASLSVRHQHPRHALHDARVLPAEWRGHHGSTATPSPHEPGAIDRGRSSRDCPLDLHCLQRRHALQSIRRRSAPEYCPLGRRSQHAWRPMGRLQWCITSSARERLDGDALASERGGSPFLPVEVCPRAVALGARYRVGRAEPRRQDLVDHSESR